MIAFCYERHCKLLWHPYLGQIARIACYRTTFEATNVLLFERKDDSRKRCLSQVLKENLQVLGDSSASSSMMAFAVQCLGYIARLMYAATATRRSNSIESGIILQQTTIWLFQQLEAREVVLCCLCKQLFM